MKIECQICHGDHPTQLCSTVKRIYGGMCVCGYSYEDHCLSMVMNEEYFNTTGGDGESYCQQYRDWATMENNG